MTMTAEEHSARTGRSYKLLLIFAMASMTMMFAGITSAYIIGKSRPDWIKDFELPTAFLYSTITIVACSISIHFAKVSIKNNNRQNTTLFLLSTLALGLLFAYFQRLGFYQLSLKNLYPTGGSITISFLFVIVLAHILHLAGGIISLLITIYNHFKQKYNATQFVGIELCAMYWHFLDLIWILLFLLLYFFK
jgi:cytochrome c oxidase subunit III